MILYISLSAVGYVLIAIAAYLFPALVKGEKASEDWCIASMVWPLAFIALIGVHICILLAAGCSFLMQKADNFEARLVERTKQKKLLKEQQQTKLLPAPIDIPIPEPIATDYRSMNCQSCGQTVK